MGVAARGKDDALADLAAALTAVATRVHVVAETAVRAAAQLVGDCAGIRLVGESDDEIITAHHPDQERFAVLAEALPGGGPGEEDYSAVLRGSRAPLVLTRPDRERLQNLAPARYWWLLEQADVHALLMCPLLADGAYLGHLTLARAGSAGGYSDAEVDLARDVAARAALAVGTAASVQRLRSSEERYRRIVETTLDGVWQLDELGVTTFVNDRMAALLGLSRQDLIGLSMRGFLDRAGQAQLPGRLAQRREGHSEVYECRLIRADGTPLWAQISAAPISGTEGGPAGSLCMVTDITERVNARDTRRQLDQLRRQDAVGQLAGGIAHDFNNLLTVVAGSAELLAADLAPGSPDHQLATQIVAAAARGADLTHQLLSFGRRSPHAHTVAVETLLDGVRQLLTRALGNHIHLEVHTAPDLWPIHADRGQLEQALVNLATNARDAMGRGGVLTIEAANTLIDPGQLGDLDIAGRFVRLAVSDTGTGMDAETGRHAFEAFYTTKAARGAAGLGLATVHSIVTTSGGHVRLYSEPRIGTTVKLYLPAADEPVVAEPSPPVDSARGHGHVLVVEDQPELAHLTRYLLQPAGYTVTVTTDAADAIAALDSGLKPDLLLTDVVMPGMTGPELVAALRAGHPGLRVLYMSGYTAGVLIPQGHLDQDATLLLKPFNRDTLLDAVAGALRS